MYLSDANLTKAMNKVREQRVQSVYKAPKGEAPKAAGTTPRRTADYTVAPREHTRHGQDRHDARGHPGVEASSRRSDREGRHELPLVKAA